MGNTTTQKIGQLSKNLMMGTTDRTIRTTPQPPMIKPVVALFSMFYAKTKRDMETPEHKNSK